MLSTSTIDSVRALAIEDVIGKYADLKKSGANFKALCPLPQHASEKTPSFTVNPAKNIFHCFGCDAGGDGIEFIMQHEKLGFIEAVKLIASQHGVQIEETEVTGKTEEQKAEEKIFIDLLQLANNTFGTHRTQVMGYLTTWRKLTPETVAAWQIGFCPDWKVAAPEIIKQNHFAIGEKYGLIRKSESGNVYDFYHHRITIPIHNLQGQLIGFGGRIHGMDGPKYVNPVESNVYIKNETLFGLHKARHHFARHGMACLVEGYFDVIKLHQRGQDNAIASCGTALTEKQAKTLYRFTQSVLIMRDGDKAGIKAIARDIPILAAQQFNITVCLLPLGQDPDTLYDNAGNAAATLATHQDGIEYLAGVYMAEGAMNGTSGVAHAIDQVVQLLSVITNVSRRDQYIKSICKTYKLKASELSKPLDLIFRKRIEDAEAAAASDDDDDLDRLPSWVDKNQLYEMGFAQLTAHTKGFRAGIYINEGRSMIQITNFTIKPLYHIFEASNNRRLVEVDNGERNAVVEMPSNAFVNKALFETALIEKGNFQTLHTFGPKQFKLLVGWLGNKSPLAFELKTLGWQPEGFFAFSNAVYHDSNLTTYDDLGMIKIEDKHYMSLSSSRLHKDERNTDNPYENDLFLSYMPPTQTDFTQWARLFAITYGDNAPFGIAFAFLTIFKDIVTRTAKMPMLYCFGPKGSGKSAMAESITWLFFSGKNGEGDLIKGYNLNPGQGTPFSFFNRVERFRNCPILMNEFDENTIEDFKFGAFKAAYDGEGREVGDGDTGKKRKTKIQKVLGTVIIVGQYLSVKDDGSVLSRSISCQFSLERVSNLTEEENQAYRELKKAEDEGLSGILTQLLKLRPEVQKNFAKEFAAVQLRMIDETRAAGHRVEARLLSNYSLMVAATKLMHDLGITLPYTYQDFFDKCKARVIAHNRMLKDNNSIQTFWKTIEVLFDAGLIHQGKEIKVAVEKEVRIKKDSEVKVVEFATMMPILYVRFDNVHSLYSKHVRERTGSPALGVETLLMYLKEQSYYLGMVPVTQFSDKRTSAFAFRYDVLNELGVNLEKYDGTESPEKGNAFKQKQAQEDLNDTPF